MFDGLLVSYLTDDGWQLGALDRGRVVPLTVPASGPPAARVADPQRLRLVTKVNGRTVQDGSTRDTRSSPHPGQAAPGETRLPAMPSQRPSRNIHRRTR